MNFQDYKTKLKDVEFYKNENGDCYLSLKYEVEYSDASIARYTFPAVYLPISKYQFSISDYCLDITRLDCGFGDLPLNKGRVKTQKGKTVKDVYYVKEIIKEAQPKEMTLDEIEKQLGHKVKIINKKGD